MKRKNFINELEAGIVVFFVALPMCLGISLACGAPPISGIISGIVGGLITTLVSRSRLSVSGTAAGVTAVVITSITALGGFQYFLAAVFFAGIFQIIFGLLRLGSVGNFLPNSVIKGMLAGIGLIIILKQLPHLVGYDVDPDGDLEFFQSDGHNSISDLYYMFRYITPGAVVVGIISFAIIFIGNKSFYKNNRFFSYLPGPLMVVIFGIITNLVFQNYPTLKIASQHLVSIPSLFFEESFNSIHSPDFSKVFTSSFWIISITISVVVSLETLINIEAVEKLDPEKNIIHPNQELVAQGIGNSISGLLGGLPVTSAIFRTSANINAGGRSKVSVIFHALLLLICVLFLSDVLSFIPNSCLAVILISTGYRLCTFELFKQQFSFGSDRFIPFICTIIFMLLSDLLIGVTAGLVVATVFILKNNINAPFEIIDDIIEGRKTYLIKLPQHITFFNKGFMIKYLGKVENNSLIIVDGSVNKTTDKDVREVLADFNENAKTRNIEIQFVKFKI